MGDEGYGVTELRRYGDMEILLGITPGEEDSGSCSIV